MPHAGCNGAAPTASSSGRLMLYNSLVDEKVPFVPAAGEGSSQISWYTCGPTVYDSAHMGHARNYVSLDIARRVLEDYFQYNCLFVMNVTDVDDKIILRARRNHLLQQYASSQTVGKEVLKFAMEAVQSAQAKQAGKAKEAQALVVASEEEVAQGAGDKKEVRSRRDELANAARSEAHKLQRIEDTLAALLALPESADVPAVLGVAGDFVAEVLDKEKGAEVTDYNIFRQHAAKYEREFMEDMTSLGVRMPDVLTRVSEYIPEVVSYIERIVSNGMAYASQGSVYFDTMKFRSSGHTYGKLKPWAVGAASLAGEGEANFETREKKCPQDFALWKASKPGEPSWPSPWGQGRPGWHIECSAMASAVIGSRMDIHSGGEDLRFPHHDNELAQAEAHYHHEGCQQWVNYFLHSGHLEIEGLKMSKSLKNFITIREALQTFTPRQLRLLFALQPWNKPMTYGEQSRTEMRAREAQLKNFFQNVEAALRSVGDRTSSVSRWEAAELELSSRLLSSQQGVHAALCDNINTAAAMDALSDIVKATNIYLAKQEEAKRPVQPLVLERCSAYVTKILSVFGIVDPAHDRPGLRESGADGDASASGSGQGAAILDAFAAFRDEVRALVRAKADPKELMAACDRVRDHALVDLGVRLEDKPDGKAVWKLDSPAAMRAEAAERARAGAEAARKKLEGALDRKVKEHEKMASLAALPSIQEALADKYSKFDAATGEPTHDKDGQELDGKARDKARKDFEKAKKVREPLAKKLAEDPQFLETLGREVAELTAQVAALKT